MPLADKAELELLIHRYTDSHATAIEVARLNELLRSNSAARALFAQYLNLDSALAEVAAGQPGQAAAVQDLVAIQQRHWYANAVRAGAFVAAYALLIAAISNSASAP